MEKNVTGYFYGTGIVGFALRSSIIRNCTVDENSEIVTTRTYYYTGGICGVSYGVIANCTNYGDISLLDLPTYLALSV